MKKKLNQGSSWQLDDLPQILRIMKLIGVFMFVALVQVSASSYSQTKELTIKGNHLTLEELFEMIENQSEFSFMYNLKQIDLSKEVDVNIKNQTVDKILNQVLEGTGITYTVNDRLIVIHKEKNVELAEKLAENQQRSVSGKVTDSSGSPLPGVTVVVKGTTNGSVTNADGEYLLTNVPEEATLQFSFVGMKTQEIPIDGKTVINATLSEETVGIEEVVAIGYGTQKKANVTGSVATVNSKTLEAIPPVASTTNALAGRLPGLISRQISGSPGRDDATLSIRGFGDALIIVDGVESGFNNIDPNEIESVTILKDASAAIYGARAGNGVILVTTKRGKDGKPTIKLNSSYSLQSITNYPKQMSSGQWAQQDREGRINAGQDESQQQFTQEQVDLYYAGTDPNYPNTNWYDLAVKPYTPMQQHNISISGGSDKIKYFGLIGYMNQQSVWKTNDGDFKRYNIRSNIDAKITKDLSMQIDFSNINEIRDFPLGDNNGNDQGIWWRLWSCLPYYPGTLPDPTKLAYGGIDQGNIVAFTNSDLVGSNKNDKQNIKASTSLKYDIPFIKGLSVKYFINYAQTYDNMKSFYKPISFYTYDYTTQIYTLKSNLPQASLTQTAAKNRMMTNQFSFNYDKVILQNHTISVLALYESVDYSDDYITASRQHFLTPAIPYLFAGSVQDQTGNGSASEMGRKSYIGRVNYSFKGKYLFEATLRADASAKFPSDKRWGYFPSVSGGWKISEENFIKDELGWIENLKLRGGIGNAGYDNVGNFAYLSGYQLGRNYIFGSNIQNGLISTGLANPNLTWEKITNYNVGLDYALFRSKVYGELDVFYRKLDGIPATRILSLPTTFGASLPPENINSSNDRGFEASIGTKGGKRDFKWDFSANISWSRAKWDHFEEPDYSGDPERARVYQKSGQWVDRVMGYKTDGLYTSQAEIDAMTFIQDGLGNTTIKPGDIKYIDVNKDGILNWKDQVDLGKGPVPHWMFGLTTTIRYKNFDLSALFQGAAGNNIYLRMPSAAVLVFEQRWSETNNNSHALFPRNGSIAQGGGFNDFYFKKGDYVRLKTLNIGYQLPESVLKGVGIQGFRVYIAGTNLLTFSGLNKYRYDPEIPNSGGNYDDAGYMYYPQQRTFTIGLTLTI